MKKLYEHLCDGDGIGRVKPTSYKLPPEGFVFGKKNAPDSEGARELISSWKFHTNSKTTESYKDFKYLNSQALKEGLHTSNQYSNFRISQNGFKKKMHGRKSINLYLPEIGFRFGQTNRPPTPINEVVENYYGNSSAANQFQLYESRILQKNQSQMFLSPKSNISADLIKSQTKARLEKINNDQPVNLFKMKRFHNVSCKVDDRRKILKEQQEEIFQKIVSIYSPVKKKIYIIMIDKNAWIIS